MISTTAPLPQNSLFPRRPVDADYSIATMASKACVMPNNVSSLQRIAIIYYALRFTHPVRLTAHPQFPMIQTEGKRMNFTANTPPPPAPKRERGSVWSWLIFLLILARPLWGIVRSLAPSQVSNSQLWLLIGAPIALAVGFLVLMSVARARNSSSTARLPIPTAPPQPMRPQQSAQPQSSMRPQQPMQSAPWAPVQRPQAPRFEPVITGRLALVGFVLAALIAGAITLIWIG